MAVRAMPIWRKRVITVAIAGFLAVHFSQLITGHHHWPFSGYPMYSYTIGERVGDGRVAFECPVVYGVPEDAAQNDFMLTPRHAALIHPNRVALHKMIRYPHRSGAYDRVVASCPKDPQTRTECARTGVIAAALRHVIDRYDRRAAKAVKKQMFPPIRGVRLYRARYELELGTSKFELAKRDLIQEQLR